MLFVESVPVAHHPITSHFAGVWGKLFLSVYWFCELPEPPLCYSWSFWRDAPRFHAWERSSGCPSFLQLCLILSPWFLFVFAWASRKTSHDNICPHPGLVSIFKETTRVLLLSAALTVDLRFYSIRSLIQCLRIGPHLSALGLPNGGHQGTPEERFAWLGATKSHPAVLCQEVSMRRETSLALMKMCQGFHREGRDIASLLNASPAFINYMM